MTVNSIALPGFVGNKLPSSVLKYIEAPGHWYGLVQREYQPGMGFYHLSRRSAERHFDAVEPTELDLLDSIFIGGMPLKQVWKRRDMVLRHLATTDQLEYQYTGVRSQIFVHPHRLKASKVFVPNNETLMTPYMREV